jgi:Family of unknown function (DUF6932)
MPIPDLDEYGFLPKGIHDCSLDEIRASFCFTSARQMLCSNLATYCDQWRRTTFPIQIYVDGGFVTRKPEEPKDIDVVIDISRLDLRSPEIAIAVRPLFDQKDLRARFNLDVFAFHPALGSNDLRAFFSYVRPEKRAELGLPDDFRKGLLRVLL